MTPWLPAMAPRNRSRRTSPARSGTPPPPSAPLGTEAGRWSFPVQPDTAGTPGEPPGVEQRLTIAPGHVREYEDI